MDPNHKEIVHEMWKDIVAFGHKVRSNGEDGLQQWLHIKKVFSCLNNCVALPNEYDLKQAPIYRIISDNIFYESQDENHDNLKLVIVPINQSLDNNDPKQHFFIQHFRIPIMSKFKIPLIKLLQIAYNVGQASVELDNYTVEQRIFYHKNNLCEFTTYIA